MWPFTKKKQEAVKPKIVSGVMPTEEGIAFFTPLVTFESQTFGRTEYIKGQRYTLRQHNLKLAKCLHRWMNEGKVKVVSSSEDPLLKVIETGSQD